jgi:hypothetical protein
MSNIAMLLISLAGLVPRRKPTIRTDWHPESSLLLKGFYHGTTPPMTPVGRNIGAAETIVHCHTRSTRHPLHSEVLPVFLCQHIVEEGYILRWSVAPVFVLAYFPIIPNEFRRPIEGIKPIVGLCGAHLGAGSATRLVS